MFLYPNSKGLTERDLASLGYSEVHSSSELQLTSQTIIFRPGCASRSRARLMISDLAEANRSRTRTLEHIFGTYIIPVLAKIGSNVQIPVQQLGPAMVKGPD